MSSRPNAPPAWVPELVRTPAATRPADEAEPAGTPEERDALRDRMSPLDWAIVLGGAAWVVVLVLVRWPAPLRADRLELQHRRGLLRARGPAGA